MHYSDGSPVTLSNFIKQGCQESLEGLTFVTPYTRDANVGYISDRGELQFKSTDISLLVASGDDPQCVPVDFDSHLDRIKTVRGLIIDALQNNRFLAKMKHHCTDPTTIKGTAGRSHSFMICPIEDKNADSELVAFEKKEGFTISEPAKLDKTDNLSILQTKVAYVKTIGHTDQTLALLQSMKEFGHSAPEGCDVWKLVRLFDNNNRSDYQKYLEQHNLFGYDKVIIVMPHLLSLDDTFLKGADERVYPCDGIALFLDHGNWSLIYMSHSMKAMEGTLEQITKYHRFSKSIKQEGASRVPSSVDIERCLSKEKSR
ncbi:MAG: hypothetical protein KGL39_01270 [Patescibacteria group bacterium]|nr:hypothetical protein [Patescibacteria group bacterium]